MTILQLEVLEKKKKWIYSKSFLLGKEVQIPSASQTTQAEHQESAMILHITTRLYLA